MSGEAGATGGRRRRVTTPLPAAPRRRVPATAAMTDRRRRVAALAGSGTAALLAAAAGGATWYYADRITEAPGRRTDPGHDAARATVVADEGAQLVLRGPAAGVGGWWGVAPDAVAPGTADAPWCRIGPPIDADPRTPPGRDDATVTRPVELRTGRLAPGTRVRLDADAVPPDPTALGLPWSERAIVGPLGPLPAWWFPADGPATPGPSAARAASERVAVLVHGRSGSRRETARWAPTIVAAGWSCLALSYRNAPGAPPSPDRRSHLGATEWQDVAAAVDAVVADGAREIVLLGTSMGGACIAELLRARELPELRGVVFDAPVRHWGPVLRAAAQQRGLPGPVLPLLLPPTMAVAGVRGRIDWRGLDHLDDPTRYRTPTLLFHGDQDATVPVALSDAFARARPDVVTYERIPGAGHVRTWNLARERCEGALTAFLATR